MGASHWTKGEKYQIQKHLTILRFLARGFEQILAHLYELPASYHIVEYFRLKGKRW